MTRRHRARPDRRPRLMLAMTAATLLVTAAVAAVVAGHGSGAPSTAVAAPVVGVGTASAVRGTTAVPSAVLPPLPPTPGPVGDTATPLPVSVAIPSLGVSSTLEPLGLLPDGTMAPPSTYDRAGWYADGTRPGDIGPAAIVGHVDSTRGPGVFFHLRDIAPGAAVTVARADGSTVSFVVESVVQVPKDRFPADVFASTPTPELLLVTCTGSFDRTARSYRDNLIVTAVPA